MINNFGGDMRPTWGVPVAEIQRGIRSGVRKVNIDTDNRMAMTAGVRRVLANDPAEFDPRKYLKEGTALMMELCQARFEAFGTAGQADRIKPLSLEAMASS
jgi:fructose-bisphosphate aldolase class II